MSVGRSLGVTRRRGWCPSMKLARHAFSAHEFAAADTTPKSVDNGGKSPGIMDQGPIGSCWGHGSARGIYAALALAGKPLPFVPSPDDLYRLARALMRARSGVPANTRLSDTGTDPFIGHEVYSLFGVRAMRAPTSDGRYSDCDIRTLNNEPVLGDIIADSHAVLVGDYGITSFGKQRILDLRKALAKTSVGLGFFCDTAFEDWTSGSPPYGAPTNPNDPNGGGHWITIDGYDTMNNGSTVFILGNSWGTGWGDHGRILVSEAFVLDPQVSDITVYAEVQEAA